MVESVVTSKVSSRFRETTFGDLIFLPHEQVYKYVYEHRTPHNLYLGMSVRFVHEHRI